MEEFLQAIILGIHSYVSRPETSFCEQIAHLTYGCDRYTLTPYRPLCSRGQLPVELQYFHLQKINSHGNCSSTCNPGSKIVASRLTSPFCLEIRNMSVSKIHSREMLEKVHTKESNPVLRPRGEILHAKGYKAVFWKKRLYLFKVGTKKSWDDAMKRCKSDGGLLAQLKENFKFYLLSRKVKFLPFIPNGSPWIGLHFNLTSGQFEWADGTAMKDKTKWLKGKITHKKSWMGGGRCVGARKSKGRVFLASFACDGKYSYICEVEGGQQD